MFHEKITKWVYCPENIQVVIISITNSLTRLFYLLVAGDWLEK